ncbi:hypothetical protein F5Y08DRAFT_339524 [Xylaria arbuscula]|nr:hypothetical protein F5Y08DRAFT_339524 [Xylaria arbuscula]
MSSKDKGNLEWNPAPGARLPAKRDKNGIITSSATYGKGTHEDPCVLYRCPEVFQGAELQEFNNFAQDICKKLGFTHIWIRAHVHDWKTGRDRITGDRTGGIQKGEDDHITVYLGDRPNWINVHGDIYVETRNTTRGRKMPTSLKRTEKLKPQGDSPPRNLRLRAMSAKPSLVPFGLRDFPADVPPPITSNSVRNFNPETIRKDAQATRVVVHHRFPQLVQRFLEHKRRHGSRIEKALYHAGWTWQQQTARLIEKRPLVFMGGGDFTKLRNGEEIGAAFRKWDRVGTEDERQNEHLVLRDYLSYDEIMLGSLIGVSGPSYFVNDGNRYNHGQLGKTGDFEPRGIIVGLVGARFEREDRMDSALLLKSVRNPKQHPELKDIFLEFFGGTRNPRETFDENLYKARIRISADILFLEASRRARAAGKKAHVYVVGLGLGVWALHGFGKQTLRYVEAFIESLEHLGHDLHYIATVEFAWFDQSLGLNSRSMTFNAGASHTSIDVRFTRRNPAEKLRGPDANHLLVLSYAWDGNAFPGNEYWCGSLSASGDPAAACMSTIGELHNPMTNPGYLNRIEVLQ